MLRGATLYLVYYYFLWVCGLWHHVCPMPTSSRLHIDSAAAYVCACICRGEAGRVWAQGRMLHVGNRVFGGQLCILLFCVWESGACCTVCAPSPPPHAIISPEQQCVYVYVFVEVERGVWGHRGACCTSTTMFFGGQ